MIMGPSLGGAPFFLALVACVSFCCYVLGDPDEKQSKKIIFEQEQIFVNVLDGPTFSLLVEMDEFGSDLKSDIKEAEGIPQGRMILKMGDTQLNYTQRLVEHIHARATLTLEIPEHQSHRSVKLKVKSLDGTELQVGTHLDNSVARLKENITQWTGIPQEEQRLLLGGKELKEDRKLALYEIYNGTTIDLGGPLEECRQTVTIFVQTLSAAVIEINLNLADTVSDLKERIWEKEGIPKGVQRLYANGRLITGKDHLCDLGIKDGSTVYMFLYSSRITSLDQVASLREPPVAYSAVNPLKAPIFHEVENVADFVNSVHRHPRPLYKNARNWIAHKIQRPGPYRHLFDPVAYLEPNPDEEVSIHQYRCEAAAFSNVSESHRLKAEIFRARVKLSLAVRRYRVAANLTEVSNYARPHPGITLGGGFIHVSPRQLVPLSADVNNWAPDAFSDADVMRLFEVSERVRQVLARGAQTGEGLLAIESQKRINHAILISYIVALAGYSSPVGCNQLKAGEQCGICMDDLTAEPAIKLACEHAFHVDCILPWAINSHREVY